jgi:hypothetical protein
LPNCKQGKKTQTKKPGQPKKVNHKAARPTSKMVNQEGQPAQNKPKKNNQRKKAGMKSFMSNRKQASLSSVSR